MSSMPPPTQKSSTMTAAATSHTPTLPPRRGPPAEPGAGLPGRVGDGYPYPVPVSSTGAPAGTAAAPRAYCPGRCAAVGAPCITRVPADETGMPVPGGDTAAPETGAPESGRPGGPEIGR